MTVFHALLLISCATEANMASTWLTDYPQITFPDEVEKIEHTYIPENFQRKYIKLLEKKAFILIDSNQYQEFVGKIPQKKYIIAVRSVSFISDMQLSMASMYTNVYQIKGKTDLLIKERAYFEPDWKTIKFHRVVLIVEVDELPENIYIIESYSAWDSS
jgi:hypothetical protein